MACFKKNKEKNFSWVNSSKVAVKTASNPKAFRMSGKPRNLSLDSID
jgi:hypothetical protein